VISYGDPVFWLLRTSPAKPDGGGKGGGKLGSGPVFGQDPKAPGRAQPSLKTGWNYKWAKDWNG
jgi:hypothetical protein